MAFAAVNVLNQALERKVSASMPECYFMHHSSQLWAKFRLLKQTLDFFRSTFSTFRTILLVILFVTMPKIYFHRSLTLSNFSDHFGTILFWAMTRIPDLIGITCLLLSPFMDSTQGPGAIRLFSQWEMQSTFSTAPLYIPWHAPRGKWLKKHNKMVHKAKTEFPQQTSRACYHEAGAINSVTYWHYIKCGKYSCCQTLTEP